jgi:hypothetical protein
MSTSLLSTIACPTSLPPVTRPATAPGIPFFSKTPETILVTAIEHNGVLCEGFQIVALPAAIEIARFQPYIATGKLNADKTPRTPRGFGTGQNEKDELSE